MADVWELYNRTGKSRCDPARSRTLAYNLDTAIGSVLVRGPNVAEKGALRVEKDFVVINA